MRTGKALRDSVPLNSEYEVSARSPQEDVKRLEQSRPCELR